MGSDDKRSKITVWVHSPCQLSAEANYSCEHPSIIVHCWLIVPSVTQFLRKEPQRVLSVLQFFC